MIFLDYVFYPQFVSLTVNGGFVAKSTYSTNAA